MVKVMYNNKLVYKVYIWVLFGIIFSKEDEALRLVPIRWNISARVHKTFSCLCLLDLLMHCWGSLIVQSCRPVLSWSIKHMILKIKYPVSWSFNFSLRMCITGVIRLCHRSRGVLDKMMVTLSGIIWLLVHLALVLSITLT